MKISIMGSGFVGTATGRGLIELGSEVIFYMTKTCQILHSQFLKE